AVFSPSPDGTPFDLAAEMAAVPVLIPAKAGDLDSLCRAADTLERAGRPFILDSVLDPIPFGLAASLPRYAELRPHPSRPRRCPGPLRRPAPPPCRRRHPDGDRQSDRAGRGGYRRDQCRPV